MSTPVPGVVQPTLKPFPEGSNSARTAGIAISNTNIKQQTSLIGTAHGGSNVQQIIKRRDGGTKKKRGGASSTITVPTMQVIYPETGGPDQSVNGNITGTTALGAKTSTDSNYDACLGQGASCTAQVSSTQKAGARRRKRTIKGGVKWGCYSGGKKSKRKNSKKGKKSKKIIRRKRFQKK